jgi:formylglycine-generating enzyme required for sulfatase activity
MRAAALLVVTAVVTVVACGPRAREVEGHLVIFFDTDAPLPVTGSELGVDRPMPLLDTIAFEIVDRRGVRLCDGCARAFSIDAVQVDAGASFVIRGGLSPSDARLHVRAFRAEDGDAADAAIRAWALLPPPPERGARVLTLHLSIARFGSKVGSLEDPIAFAEGAPRRPRAVHPAVVRRECTAEPRAQTACVPSGVFWMGRAHEVANPFIMRPRIVGLRPFFIDRHEVTVREFRRAGGTAIAHSGRLDGDSARDFCTFTAEPGRFEDYPVNCVEWADARAYCVGRGGDLPTEAQWEYVASSTRSFPYPWGRDRPSCADVVFHRGPRAAPWVPVFDQFGRDCLPDPAVEPPFDQLGFPKAALRPDHGRDVMRLPSGDVVDLIGNVAEWVRDDFDEATGPCWRDLEFQIEPVCAGDARQHAIRGTAWSSATVDGQVAAFRQPVGVSAAVAGLAIGFRCVYPGT